MAAASPARVGSETGGRHPRTGNIPGLDQRSDMQESWATKECNAATGERLLEPVAGATGCKQCVPRKIAIMLLSTETAYGPISEPIRDTLLRLQGQDPFVVKKVYEEEPIRGRAGREAWKVDQEGLLRFGKAVYVPPEKALRSEVIQIHHDSATAGHFGVAKTLELIRRKYFWKGLKRDIKEHISTCPECQRGKARRHRPYGELAPFPTPTKPWEEITMDFITDLPPSKWGGQTYDSILVVVDRFTKLARYIPVRKTIDAPELADIFVQHIYKDFGCPKGITTDRGSVFTSKFWKTVTWYLQARRRLSTAFHPQTDGQTERQNQTLEFYLRVFCDFRQSDWCSKLALAEFTYNNSTHSSTGSTPFRLLYGFDPELGMNVGDNVLDGAAASAEERIKTLIQDRNAVTTTLRLATESHKKFYDKKHKAIRFKVKEKVLVSAKNIRQLRPNKKLSNKFLGPFEVTAVLGKHGQAYQLELPPHYKIHNVFHVSLLEPWNGRKGVDIDTEDVRIQDDVEYEVKSIQAHRDTKKGREYLVRWKGYTSNDDTWEPIAHLVNVPEEIEKYLANTATSITKSRRKRKGWS
jgi:transposase InsO family protein